MYAFIISLILFFLSAYTYTNDYSNQIAVDDQKKPFNGLYALNSILEKELMKAEEMQDKEKTEKIKHILTILAHAKNSSSLELQKNDNKTLHILLSKGTAKYGELDRIEKIIRMIGLCACGIPLAAILWKLMFEVFKVNLPSA